MISFIMNDRTEPAPAPLVVKLGGAGLEDPDSHADLWQALCALHQAEPGGVVLVHGGGKAVDARFQRLGFVSERREGIRITPREHVDEVVAVLAGNINTRVIGLVQRHGVPAVGLSLADGFLADTMKSKRYSFDPGRVGEITGGDPRVLTTLLGAGFMPVLCSIGLDGDGEPLNINADEAAGAVASLLGARGLILLTDVDGVLDASGRCVEHLTAAELEQRITSGEIRNGMIPKARAALEAANGAGVPATIASWKHAEDLLSIARGEGVGTWIVPDEMAKAQSAKSPNPRGALTSDLAV